MLLVVVFTVTGGAGFTATAITVGLVLDVRECNVYDIHNMLVVQGVEHVFAVAATLYKAFVFQKAELMGHCRLGHINCCSNIVYAELIGAE